MRWLFCGKDSQLAAYAADMSAEAPAALDDSSTLVAAIAARLARITTDDRRTPYLEQSDTFRRNRTGRDHHPQRVHCSHAAGLNMAPAESNPPPALLLKADREPAAREVLRRLVALKLKDRGPRSWHLVAGLPIPQVLAMVVSDQLRDELVHQAGTVDATHDSDRGNAVAPPFADYSHPWWGPAKTFASYLRFEPKLSVTQLLEAVPLAQENVPAEWGVTLMKRVVPEEI